MNFESPKKRSPERNVPNNENSKFSEVIKEVYKDGRRIILGYFILLGLMNPEQSTDTTKEDLASIQTYFKKIDSTQSVQISQDLDQMFNLDELHLISSMYNEDKIVNIPQALEYYKFLLNPENRKKMIEIDKEFKLSPRDVRQLTDPLFEETQSLIESPDFNSTLLPKIKELRKLFSKSDNPSVQFIDMFEKFKCLSNPEYPKALEFILDKNYEPFRSNYAHPPSDIIEIYNSPYFKKIVGIFDDRGIYFNESIALCNDKKKQEQFFNFLNEPKNEKILSLFSKQSPLGGYEMQILSETETVENRWRPILENPVCVKKLESLFEYGFSIRNLFLLSETHVDKLMYDENYLKGFLFLLEKEVDRNDRDDVVSTIESILSYYSDNKIDLVGLEADFESLNKASTSKLRDFNEKLELKKWETFKPVMSRTMDERDIHVDEFAEDPALQYIVGQMDLFKNVPNCLKKFPSDQQKEWILRVARNMYISRMEPTMTNFEQVFEETIRIRNNPELLEQSLFKNRNVLVFAHNEMITDSSVQGKDKVRFGNEKTLDAIESQETNDVYVVRSSLNTSEDLQEKKDMFFEYILKNKNLTVFVTAHGGPNGIFLTEGIPNKQGKIAETGKEEYVSPRELGMVLEQRYDTGLKDTPIFIFESCYNQNYIRNLYRMIDDINSTKNKKIPYPIMCGSTEFGQFGYSNFNSSYRDKFIEAILEGKKDTKIKDLIEIEAGAAKKGILTNVSLFVPILENIKGKEEVGKNSVVKKKYYQIAEVNEDKIQQSHIQQYAKSIVDGSIDGQTASYFEQVQPGTAKSIRELLDKKNQNTPPETIV